VTLVAEPPMRLPSPQMTPDTPSALRRALPSRRRSVNHALVCNGQKLYLTCGEYADGTLGEIFIDGSKDGTVIRSQMNMFAISMSLGLQHGTPLSEFVTAFRDFKTFRTPAPVIGHDGITQAHSLFDLVVRVLEAEYGDGQRTAAEEPATCEDAVCEPCTEMLYDDSTEATACHAHADDDGHRAEPEV